MFLQETKVINHKEEYVSRNKRFFQSLFWSWDRIEVSANNLGGDLIRAYNVRLNEEFKIICDLALPKIDISHEDYQYVNRILPDVFKKIEIVPEGNDETKFMIYLIDDYTLPHIPIISYEKYTQLCYLIENFNIVG